MKEITIVGGGLAGLSLGVCLRKQGIPVRLMESGAYPRHKVCGEFIAGVSEETLEYLGIASFLADAERHEQMRWWMGDACVLNEGTPSVALGISRYLLDQRLAAEFVRLGGELELKCAVSLKEAGNEGWVWAAGKGKSKDSNKNWIGLKIHAVGVKAEDLKGLAMHSGQKGKKNGYLGLCPIENSRVNCCGLFEVQSEITPSQASKRWGVNSEKVAMLMSYAEACGMAALVDWLQDHDFDDSSFSAIAGFNLGSQSIEHLFCIGDAAYLIPPFTGNGMSMALESSRIAAVALSKFSKGECDWDVAVRENNLAAKKFFAKRTTIAKMLHPLFFHPLGQMALRSVASSGFPSFQTLFKLLRKP